jgi:glucose/arabinose dehydrogenase
MRWLPLLVVLAGCASGPQLSAIRLPPGFEASVYADNVPDARGLAIGSRGTLFVGSKSGKVYAVPPGGGKALPIASGLEAPHGVAFRDGALYVAERQRVLRYDGIESRLDAPPAPAVVLEGLPPYAHHGLRPLNFGPDGKLYFAVGFPCNVCIPEDKFGVIARFDPSSPSPSPEIVAHGVRNSVGFDWDPTTGALWFTDNGRDLLGHDVPPDELNHAPKAGLDFGFPYCHGGWLADPEFGLRRSCAEFTPPAQNLGPHVAALGMRFYTGAQFPPRYRNAIFIAEHGSWNRQPMIGYRVTVVTLREGKPQSYETFAEGWLQGDDAWGRPVDVIVARDGALLVSDDKAGAVYRITYVPAPR